VTGVQTCALPISQSCKWCTWRTFYQKSKGTYWKLGFFYINL